MKLLKLAYSIPTVIGLLYFTANFSVAAEKSGQKSFFDYQVKDAHGEALPLSKFKNMVVLVVNTASKCGFTPQFADLETIYQKYKDQGFVVLAFPSNDFKQDPEASTEKIEKWSKENYKISFPMVEKAPVRGADKQPVYEFLVNSKSGVLFKEVGWNFEKFLVGRDGRVIDRWISTTKPTSENITSKIEEALRVK